MHKHIHLLCCISIEKKRPLFSTREPLLWRQPAPSRTCLDGPALHVPTSARACFGCRAVQCQQSHPGELWPKGLDQPKSSRFRFRGRTPGSQAQRDVLPSTPPSSSSSREGTNRGPFFSPKNNIQYTMWVFLKGTITVFCLKWSAQIHQSKIDDWLWLVVGGVFYARLTPTTYEWSHNPL